MKVITSIVGVKKGATGIEDERTSRNYTDHNIVKILLEFSDDSWRPDETCCHSGSIERPAVEIGVKILDK